MMQQVPGEEPEHQWQQGYRTYSTDSSYAGRTADQKLSDESDEQFADLLVRKIKDQLKDELRSNHDKTLGYRLALAIVSICILVPIFIAFVVALVLGLSGGATIGLTWSLIAICIAISVVNANFNRIASGRSYEGTSWNSGQRPKDKTDKPA
ncbi:hypothetical protein [Dictyobacter kobayashii]|uniref:Uncharacterized protein n=1 Tax=Dictyobacter kobayashii TaxID=2014872 RepID=A0A402ADJ2_9CHLR|nr:hypothetical protein [Dictyobacter kobayashii]GCE17177.1 hypothetical protein KDK_09770 [Dictyobacter kobayashii]